MFIKAMELHEEGTEHWADSAASAFDLLRLDDCDDGPKPEWWNDEALKALSARVVSLAPCKAQPCAMRADVLCGDALGLASWNAGPRTAAEIKEAATWYRRASMATHTTNDKICFEALERACDEVADPLVA